MTKYLGEKMLLQVRFYKNESPKVNFSRTRMFADGGESECLWEYREDPAATKSSGAAY